MEPLWNLTTMASAMFSMSTTHRRSRMHFFFQAEDGIRAVAVTGVQTCALPIWFGKPAEQGCIEDARGDGHHTNAVAGQIARDWQGHADDAALRGRVGGLADLAVEG